MSFESDEQQRMNFVAVTINSWFCIIDCSFASVTDVLERCTLAMYFSGLLS